MRVSSDFLSRAHLFLIASIVLFFASKWVFDGAWFLGDMITFTGPVENIFRTAQLKGQIPIWDSNLAGGYPIIANGQISFWYPLHFLLRFIFPGPYLLNVTLLLHSLLAATGMYWWLRRNKFASLAAVMGGGLFVFGAAFAARFGLTNFIPPLAWVPWILGVLQAYLEEGSPKWLWWWILTSALHILSGHPQAVVLGLFVEFIWALVLILPRVFQRNAPAKLIWHIFLAGVLVIGLTAIQIIPTMTLLKYTDRAGGLTTEELIDFSIPPKAWWGIIIPHLFGHAARYTGLKGEAELALFIGPVAAALAVAGLIKGKRYWPAGWWLAITLMAMGVVLALGKYSSMYRWLATHTPQRYFAIPARYGLLVHVAFVLLTALGTRWLCQYIKRAPVVAGLLLTAALLPPIWVAWTWEEGQPWQALAPSPAVATLQGRPLVQLFSKVHLTDLAPSNNFGIGLGPPVAAGRMLHQTFRWPYKEVNGLKLRLSASPTEGDLTVKIYADSNNLLREIKVPTRTILDGEWTIFSFNPLTNVGKEAGYWELTSNLPATAAPHLYIHQNPEGLDFDPTGSFEGRTDASFAWTTQSSNLLAAQVLLGPNVAVGYGLGSTQWTGAFGLPEAKTLARQENATHVIGLFPPYRGLSKSDGFQEEGSWPIGEEFLRLYRQKVVAVVADQPSSEIRQKVESSFSHAWPLTLLSVLVVLLAAWSPRVGGG